MPALTVQIVRFVDEHQPGFVECVLLDAENKEHVFVEKVPIVSTEDLWATSSYPRVGTIECVIEQEWEDAEGRLIVRADTEHPWHVESSTGETSFVVLASQVLRSERDAAQVEE